jgi:hypothetical protein
MSPNPQHGPCCFSASLALALWHIVANRTPRYRLKRAGVNLDRSEIAVRLQYEFNRMSIDDIAILSFPPVEMKDLSAL